MLAPIPEYIPPICGTPLSPRQIVWLEAYKATMCRSYYTNSDSCAAAENAIKAFDKVFKGGDTL